MHIESQLPPALLRPMALAGVGAVLLAAGAWWLARPVSEATLPPSSIRPIAASSAEARAATVLVHVVGDVRRPGVVRLPSGARVVDAVAAAGGLRPGRAPIVNLARPVVDGEQIVVGAPAAGVTAATSAAGRVDLNAATVTELDGLSGIGPVLAQRIIDYRAAHGRFMNKRDLLQVPGIGDSKYAQLADVITVA